MKRVPVHGNDTDRYILYRSNGWRMLQTGGKYKTWTPGPWTPSVDPVHGPGPSKYGPGPWTGSMDRVHGPGPWTPLFPTPKNTTENNKKLKELN